MFLDFDHQKSTCPDTKSKTRSNTITSSQANNLDYQYISQYLRTCLQIRATEVRTAPMSATSNERHREVSQIEYFLTLGDLEFGGLEFDNWNRSTSIAMKSQSVQQVRLLCRREFAIEDYNVGRSEFWYLKFENWNQSASTATLPILFPTSATDEWMSGVSQNEDF